ncbi:dolichyl-phosphate-mannose-protein mannosyltransferase [Georgenia soli]|uniref:Polyprenol-phosphate-mannose--protein mannosyltransferase n=1 Tax=Georgenia soli TaxID=638953 RepID=A0A2A9EKY9_9MICO|nr:phospholipid carrier-dependent glycosyltransferase [Georgenia soli]PFG38879.1 dolichyl-phosphate-mannose-protein mannosyltransferase [Georgenia soli]
MPDRTPHVGGTTQSARSPRSLGDAPTDDGGTGHLSDDERRDLARSVLRRGFRERRATGPGSHAARGPRSAVEIEADLRSRLGLPALAARLDPTVRLWGWLGPLLVTVLAAVMRLVNLNHPSRLIFDETYYVKQAFSMLTLGYEGEWKAEDANDRFVRGDYSDLSTVADYVVHPSVGKWMIAVGLRLFGADNGAGWRFAAAVVGTISVLLLARIAFRMFGSVLLATVAGLLLAIDGMHLTESRTSLLDIFLMFWVLVGFWFVLKDRDATRAVLARRTAEQVAAEEAATGARATLTNRLAPKVGPRWWLVGAGVALGLACGVKWSGIYAVAVFGVMVFVWDTCARRAVGARSWLADGVLRGGLPAFLALVPTAALTYVATWFSWFTHPDAYRRQWAADLRASGATVPRSWLPDSLNSWWEYHLVMWDFHNNLTPEHAYASHPVGWLIQWRPTSFYWPDPAPPPEACGAQRCVEAITSIGNPVVWWLAALALLVLIYIAVRGRDWRAWAILAGYAAMYLPWFAYAHRTIFTFYAVAFVPYVVLCLVYVLGRVMGLVRPPRPLRASGGAAARDTESHGVPTPDDGTTADLGTTNHGTAIHGTTGPGTADHGTAEHGTAEHGTADPRTTAEPSPERLSGAPVTATAPAAAGAPVAGRAPSATGGEAPTGARPGASVPRAPSTLDLLLTNEGSVRLTRRSWVVLGVVVGLAVLAAAFWWPIWTGQTVSYDFWHWHMWLPSWI